MKLCVVGTGYVGLVAGTCFAEVGHDVICCDIDEQKIAGLRKGKLPIYEPGLDELVLRNVENGRLQFTTDLKEGVADAEVCIIAVGTPSAADGSADLSAVFAVGREIAKAADGYRVVVTKSTVPVGTCDKLIEIFKEHCEHDVDLASNPEFLREGVAVQDFLVPDRVIIGSYSEKALDTLTELYKPVCKENQPILRMTPRAAETAKYAANAMLATKISFMNDLANLCEKIDVDVEMIREGISFDHRIGPHFLYAGAGYGGSCFPKDIKALVQVGHQYDYNLRIVEAVELVNVEQKKRLFQKLTKHVGDVKGKNIAVWGLAFKPETDDMREAPSIPLIHSIVEAGGTVQVHDPVAFETAKPLLPKEGVTYVDEPYAALEGADALVVVTEWKVFRQADLEKVKSLLKQAVIVDGRNIYSPQQLKDMGFVYDGIGRSA